MVGDPDGSGKNAYVPGYRVGGKTGTSEKLDAKEGGEVTRRIASFMGIAPSNDPQVLVLVILDEPQMQNIYGSVIAAPVVGAIMSDILPYLKVEPQYTEAELSDIEVKVPYVTGGVVHDALSALTARGLSYKLVGDGVNVTGQIPSSGTECPKGTKVILYTCLLYTSRPSSPCPPPCSAAAPSLPGHPSPFLLLASSFLFIAIQPGGKIAFGRAIPFRQGASHLFLSLIHI